ncbi:Uncharacterized protein YnzC, UPF0291/DUF896 family [Granulicatella balaenopterae]|uniref:UPF0291 protein SAMN05421767_12716 n=2 Tax=Granulicatella balaenopterae TaxID=137733 RepID=A0A1H9MHV9_9LACT|nr:Uncharacterized protein YnzC, UPF0291/DUF896 family [Granulicatella balaenopterae]
MEMDQILSELKVLSAKKKAGTITPEEVEKQKALREEYMTIFRSALRGHIEGIKVVDNDGNDITPDKLKQVQKEKGIHGRHLED